MSAWFALVESNTSGTGRLFARAACALGHRPVLLCADPARYPYATTDAVDVCVLDTSDPEAVERACQQLTSADGLAGVLSSSEYFLAVAARVARRLGLPGADPEAVYRCRDKESQRQLMAEAGLPVPGFRTVAAAVEAVRAASGLGGRVVLKPVDGPAVWASGSFRLHGRFPSTRRCCSTAPATSAGCLRQAGSWWRSWSRGLSTQWRSSTARPSV